MEAVKKNLTILNKRGDTKVSVIVIDVKKDPFAYNKDFNENDPKNVQMWFEMQPSHMTPGEWQFAVGELFLMVRRPGISMREYNLLVLGWKYKNGLLSS